MSMPHPYGGGATPVERVHAKPCPGLMPLPQRACLCPAYIRAAPRLGEAYKNNI